MERIFCNADVNVAHTLDFPGTRSLFQFSFFLLGKLHLVILKLPENRKHFVCQWLLRQSPYLNLNIA
jgi:hypothetical protein